tara:strand:+ start:848 stop:1177 length:330 start_codon:yes stop_codon:yes gene_type:complete
MISSPRFHFSTVTNTDYDSIRLLGPKRFLKSAKVEHICTTCGFTTQTEQLEIFCVTQPQKKTITQKKVVKIPVTVIPPGGSYWQQAFLNQNDEFQVYKFCVQCGGLPDV